MIHGLETHSNLISQIILDTGVSNIRVLSDAETQAAKTSIILADHNIEALDNEIGRLLERKRQEVDIRQKLRHALVSIKLIPHEILAEIFVHTLDGQPITFIERRNAVPPWVLLDVCLRWREVALSEHRLWNYVTVDVEPFRFWLRGKESRDQAMQKWDAYTIKSLNDKILPHSNRLSLQLKCPSHEGWIAHSFSALLRPCLPFLTELVLHIPIRNLTAFYKLPPALFSRLDSVQLAFYHEESGDYEHDLHLCRNTVIFSEARYLRKFSLWTDVDGVVLPNSIPWQQLFDVDIDMEILNSHDMISVLRKCVNSRQCRFGSGNLPSPLTSGQQLMTLPLLRSLTLRRFDHVLDLLHVPSLTSLHIESGRFGKGLDAGKVIALVQHSKCTLRELFHNFSDDEGRNPKIPTTIPDQESFRQLLAFVPTIQTLRIPYSPLSSECLVLIGSGELLPMLATLECGLTGESYPCFVELVERRLYDGPSGDLSQLLGSRSRSLREAIGKAFSIPRIFDRVAWERNVERIGELRDVYGRRLELTAAM